MINHSLILSQALSSSYNVHWIPPVFACSRTFVKALGLSIVLYSVFDNSHFQLLWARWEVKGHDAWSRGIHIAESALLARGEV